MNKLEQVIELLAEYGRLVLERESQKASEERAQRIKTKDEDKEGKGE